MARTKTTYLYTSEVADLFGVTPAAVSNWVKREVGWFPSPVKWEETGKRSRPLWRARDILRAADVERSTLWARPERMEKAQIALRKRIG
jgi:predicted transcriptional regulator